MINKDNESPLIAIDVRILHTHPFRGSSRHLCSVIKCLNRKSTLLLSNENIDLSKFDLDGYENVVFGHKQYALWEQVSLPLWLKNNRHRANYILCPNHTSPIASYVKKIIVIHDLIYMRHLFYYPPTKLIFWGSLYRSITTLLSIVQGSKVITVSNFTKTQIHRFFTLMKNSVNVVGNPYFESSGLRTANVDRDRVLMVAGLMKHKNFKNGIKGFFKSEISKKYRLTIVGINPALITNMKEIPDRIDWRWNITDKELSQLYHESVILLFPSTIEGFGIPLLEAMEFKLKICCSGNSVFPEICGDSATYFDPFSPTDISRALDESDFKSCPTVDYKKILTGFNKKRIEFQMNKFIRTL